MPEGFGKGEYQAMKKHPEARDYRDSMANAIRRARAYDGTENRYHELMSSLEGLEDTIKTSPSIPEAPIVEQEIEAALRFAPRQPHDINDVLGIAAESRKKYLRQAFENPEAKDSPLLIHQIETVILPPDSNLVLYTGLEPFEPAELETRLDTFIAFLAKHGVYADDLIATVGPVPEKSLRRASYTHVEIPRLDRTVLLCDQIGEATFVMRGYFDPATPWTKEQLQAELPHDCQRVVKYNQKNWEEKLHSFLFVDEAWPNVNLGRQDFPDRRKQKIDVAQLDRLRAMIIQQISIDEFLTTPIETLRSFRVENMGLQRLFTLFGVNATLHQKRSLLNFAERIWGRANSTLQKHIEIINRTQDDWCKILRQKFTPQAWIELKAKEIGALEIDGYKYLALASASGIQLQEASKRDEHISFGRHIWGDQAFVGLVDERELTAAPFDWMTVNALVGKLQRSTAAVAAKVKSLAVSHPQFIGRYKHHTKGSVRDFISPEGVEIITREMAAVPVVKEYWHDGITIPDNLSSAPEDWMSIRRLIETANLPEGVAWSLAETVQKEHPEWFQIAKSKKNGRIHRYLSPQASDEIKRRSNEFERATSGWLTITGAESELDMDHATIAKYANVFRPSHPEWFRWYLDTRSRHAEHLSPELIAELKRVRNVPTPPNEHWKTNKAIAKVLGSAPATVTKYIVDIRADHPDWFMRCLSPRGNVLEYCAPEVTDELRFRINKKTR